MSSNSPSTASARPASRTTSALVASHATLPGGMKLNQTNLIGIYGKSEQLNALVRSSSGRIRRVKVGQRLGLGLVVGIDKNGLMLRKNNRTERLGFPQG